MTLPTISGEFRLVDDPQMRFGQGGSAICNLRLVANGRKFDRDSQQWVDDKVVWLNASCFGQTAEHVAESVQKGDLVVINGELHTRSFERNDGTNGQSYEVIIRSIGPGLAFATARAQRVERTGGQQGGQQRPAQGGQPQQGYGQQPGTMQRASGPQQGDPWGGGHQAAPQQQAPVQQQPDPWGGNPNDQPPF